jgi:hypothetical protein
MIGWQLEVVLIYLGQHRIPSRLPTAAIGCIASIYDQPSP